MTNPKMRRRRGYSDRSSSPISRTNDAYPAGSKGCPFQFGTVQVGFSTPRQLHETTRQGYGMLPILQPISAWHSASSDQHRLPWTHWTWTNPVEVVYFLLMEPDSDPTWSRKDVVTTQQPSIGNKKWWNRIFAHFILYLYHIHIQLGIGPLPFIL